jgi:transcriptional regulator with XRE-family HTH domain
MDDIQSQSVSPFTLSDQAAEELRALLARRRMSGRDLAKRLGVSPSWVSYRLTGTTEIGLNDLQRIAEALDVQVVDLLPAPVRKAGGLTESSPRATGQPRSTSAILAHPHHVSREVHPEAESAIPPATLGYRDPTPDITRERRPVRLCGGSTR